MRPHVNLTFFPLITIILIITEKNISLKYLSNENRPSTLGLSAPVSKKPANTMIKLDPSWELHQMTPLWSLRSLHFSFYYKMTLGVWKSTLLCFTGLLQSTPILLEAVSHKTCSLFQEQEQKKPCHSLTDTSRDFIP